MKSPGEVGRLREAGKRREASPCDCVALGAAVHAVLVGVERAVAAARLEHAEHLCSACVLICMLAGSCLVRFLEQELWCVYTCTCVCMYV